MFRTEPEFDALQRVDGVPMESQGQSITVLITGAGTVTCQSVIKGLRAQSEFDLQIVTADMSPANAGRYLGDHFEQIPAADSPEFIPSLLEICTRRRVELLIPVVDYEFMRLAPVKEQFAQIGCRLVLSDAEVIATCDDKWKTYQFFLTHGVETPETWLPSEALADRIPYPVFVKPRRMGRGSIDAYPAASRVELERLLAAVEDPLVQRLTTGEEYTIDVLCDFAGRAVNGVVRQRSETKAGVSYKGKTVRNQEVLEQAVAIAEALPIVGPANLQCFWDGRQATFFEVNPRYSGTLALSIAAGFNSPHELLRLHRGLEVPRSLGAYREEVAMYRFWQEVIVDERRSESSVPFGGVSVV